MTGQTHTLSLGFDNIYNDINTTKGEFDQYRTIHRKYNLHTTEKFKHLTRVLDRYYRVLVNQGKTEHIDRAIRNTQQMLIQEGNLCKEQ